MVFARLHTWVLKLCATRQARFYLYLISFSESIFFPIPTDVALFPVVVHQPRHWWILAGWCTLASVLGALLSYALAQIIYTTIVEWWPNFAQEVGVLSELIRHDAFLIVFLSAITPIPYKVCAITAGLASLSLPIFILASFIGRGGRYFLVAWLAYRFNKEFHAIMRRYVEPLGWILGIGLIVYLVF